MGMIKKVADTLAADQTKGISTADNPLLSAGDIAANPTEGLSQAYAPQQPESGATAAIERLKTAKPKAETKATYKARDYASEARGKVKCVMFEAALQSPAIAGLRFDDLAGFIALVEQAADAGVAYTWKQ